MKKATFVSIIFLCILNYKSQAQTAAQKVSILNGIDWLHTSTGPPTKFRTYFRAVPAGEGMYWVRGSLSAHSCLMNATIFALAGEYQYAIEWLQAGQDHNLGAQNDYATYPDMCIEYIKRVYGNEAMATFGYSVATKVPLQWIRSTAEGIERTKLVRRQPASQSEERPKTNESTHGRADRSVF